ncbi:MAG: DMT family transporter [bacterium]|nr:DMT family transporter [bacterium]
MWIAFAVSASVLWGLSYTITEHLMKKVSIPGVMLAGAVGSLMIASTAALVAGTFQKDIQTLKNDAPTSWLLAGNILIYVAANTLILMATKSKNATMAAMIEISYPLFTALFAYMIFKQTQFNAGTLVGATMVLAGVCCIYYFGKNI